MQNPEIRLQELSVLEAKVQQAVQNGQDGEAAHLWARILELEPRHGPALTALGQRAFRSGDLAAARDAFEHLVEINDADLQQWINLAVIYQGLKDEEREETAIQRALTLDPMDLISLILRANLLERQGKTHQAAIAYGAVATVAPPLERLAPDLRPAVLHAIAQREKHNREFGAFLDKHLEPHYNALAGKELKRFRDSVDILVGRKKRYDSFSSSYHYPNLAPIEFFERSDFPWLDAIEAGTGAIRAEFLSILKQEEGFAPYISYANDMPLNQWVELNNSPRWSAFHLYKFGKRVAENAAKCPATMALLAGAPQPDQPGRTPSAMFSLLKPNTRIPPHSGVSNVRLVTHLPLIIPEKCGFRVGNDTREWVPGKAWVFDDTIEHEAWNNSDQLRVVLIFDVWHPQLTAPERAMISALAAAIGAFSGDAASFDL